MAVAPFTQPWFSHWSPPSHIINTYNTPQLPPKASHSFSYDFFPSHHDVAYNLQIPYGGQPAISDHSQFSEIIPEEYEKKSQNRGRNGYPLSLKHVLPVMMISGMMSGGLLGSQRGDQTPDTPDPDRDLGGPAPLRTLYHWKLVDFEYETNAQRMMAIDSKQFIPLNTLPLGIEVYKDRVFVTFPRWKEGVPCTLATLPRSPKPSDISPKFKPYPDWYWHSLDRNDCNRFVSVFRMHIDHCGRLWVLDSGQIVSTGNQICPPQILAFDLETDTLIGRWPVPERYVLQNSLFTNILSDVRDTCDDVHIYFTDVWRFGLLVFRMKDEKFWKFNSNYFYPDPFASDYTLNGINFQWMDGVFGLSITPRDDIDGDRTLYFHPMSSHHEFKMPVSVLRNESAAEDTALLVKVIKLAGNSRGENGQSSAAAIARNGVMFFNLVLRDSVGCWDTRKPYITPTLGVVARDKNLLNFPNDLKVDKEDRQSVWVLSNKLPTFSYRQLNPNDINFRIMREYVDEAVEGTICDPNVIDAQNEHFESDLC